MPFASLPNYLCLRKRSLESFVRHGFGVASSFNGQPLLVGYRNGSRLKKKISSVDICLGHYWYGMYAGPFLKASQTIEDRIEIEYRSYVPGHRNKRIRKIIAIKERDKWSFMMYIPRPSDNVMVFEAFKWRHRQKYRVGTREEEGYILVQLSTKQAVARMTVSGSLFSGDLEIEYLGSGRIYGGLWKLVALVVGIFGTPDMRGSFWSRR